MTRCLAETVGQQGLEKDSVVLDNGWVLRARHDLVELPRDLRDIMFLKPDGRIDLRHRANFLRGAPDKSRVIAAAEDGHFSILSSNLNEARSHRHPSKIRAISLDPTHQQLVVVDGKSGSLTLLDLDGKRLLEIAAPQLDENTPRWVKPGFDACHFDETDKLLWLGAPRNAEEYEIRLVETEEWSLVDKAILVDPFGGSSCSFYETGKPGLTSLWLAAGQDGQRVFWLNRTMNRFSCTLEPRLADTFPPVFSPNGDHFLVVNDNDGIRKFAFPEIEQLGLPLQSRDEETLFSGSLCYFNEGQALAGTGYGRIFLVDTDCMSIEDEVAVEDHEPRPIGEYYPTLVNEQRLGTDISYFRRLGNVIIFVYGSDQQIGLDDQKDTLLWLSLKGRE
jgi:hypothetical protein